MAVFLCALADILKMATILTIFCPIFELKLEIPNICLCVSLKSIGQQIKILQHISDGRTNGRTPDISISPAPIFKYIVYDIEMQLYIV
jgi:hypothetical protein